MPPDTTGLQLAAFLSERELWSGGVLVSAIVEGTEGRYLLENGHFGLIKESWCLVYESRIYDDTDDVTDVQPVIDDPGTRGVLLDILRTVRGDPSIYVALTPGTVWTTRHGHAWDHGGVYTIGSGDTEGLALARALLATPEATP
ncbi:MAG: hypothetical protein GY913_25950 [Proteobacteria bacterium]|nr:hypothetical protein [Pseudomonadota bacterium]